MQAGGRRFDPGWLHFLKALQIWWLRTVIDREWEWFCAQEGGMAGALGRTPDGTARFVCENAEGYGGAAGRPGFVIARD